VEYTGSNDFWPFEDETSPEAYLDILAGPLIATRRYEKREMPQADPFMHWFGLNTSIVSSARARAGLVTSIYRQIGLGCERLLVRLVQDKFGIPSGSCAWSQVVEGQRRSLDACLRFADVEQRSTELRAWVAAACVALDIPQCETGVVFEVRQGHKSGDSKRQLGDKKNAAKALQEGFLPVMLVFSTQLPKATHQRYERDGWLVLTGRMGGGPLKSTYAFFRDVVDFDLALFLEDHQDRLQAIVQNLMKPSSRDAPP
jgi:hypothetical protein